MVKKTNLRTFVPSVVLFVSQAVASPLDTPTRTVPADTLRYIPGALSEVTKDLELDRYGAMNLGADGVLRSFANNLTVIDYRHLDPFQIQDMVSSLIVQFKRRDGNVPAELERLSDAVVDGRHVTDIAHILNPVDKPKIYPVSDCATSTVTERGLDGLAEGDVAQAQCTNPPCMSLNDCLLAVPRCMACYFPAGPPNGTCFQNGG